MTTCIKCRQEHDDECHDCEMEAAVRELLSDDPYCPASGPTDMMVSCALDILERRGNTLEDIRKAQADIGRSNVFLPYRGVGSVVDKVCDAYGITDEQLASIRRRPVSEEDATLWMRYQCARCEETINTQAHPCACGLEQCHGCFEEHGDFCPACQKRYDKD